MKQLMDILYYILGMMFNICFTVVLIALVFVATLTAFNYGTGLFVEDLSAREDREVIVEIVDGRDTMAVAEVLRENGLIESSWLFVLQARLNGSYRWFRSDTFVLNENMGSAAIMQVLQEIPELPPGEEVRVTIPEGMSLRQIAAHTAHLGYWTEAEFMAAAQGDFPHAFLRDIPNRANRLQGYLFPSTYFLPPDPSPEDLIVRMLDEFDRVFFSMFALGQGADFSMDEIVIMASIIEREIRVDVEKELAAAVIRNRLARGLRLEMYSTVQYIADSPRDRLTQADFQRQSPYNTFVNHGLPVGPIGSPSRRALEAAISPAMPTYPDFIAVDYTRFVLRDDGSGRHDFE